MINSPGARASLSTAAKEHDKAIIALREAEDAEWHNPDDPVARRRVNFWSAERDRLAGLDPETVIPLF